MQHNCEFFTQKKYNTKNESQLIQFKIIPDINTKVINNNIITHQKNNNSKKIK